MKEVDVIKKAGKRAKQVMSIEEATERLGLARQSGYVAAKRGDIPTIRIGRRVLVPIRRFEQMLDGQWSPSHDREERHAG